ncbi:MAG: hypothetical protein J6X16_05955 [Bacteroidales bacterium]|nr:hypothetical protein [Bacteroidales bacterium]
MPTLKDFEKFIQSAVDKLNGIAQTNPEQFTKCNGKSLENKVVTVLQGVCEEKKLGFNPKQIELVSGQNFPDIIVAGRYGLEVKSTKENHWKSTGSSIVESTRVANVEHIYLLFGKLGGKVEFRCRPYEEVMYDVTVTHSPRYLINMELQPQQSIFDKMKIKYKDLCNPKSGNPINRVRQYYIQKAKEENKTSMPWWLESDTQMSIQLWSSLSKKEKEILQSKMCILFSNDILSNKKEKYARVSLWLCAKYSILVYNARDCFSAGGQCSILGYNNVPQVVPQVVARYLQRANKIKELFNPTPEIKKEIKEEILEFNKDIWDEVNDKPNYEKWLTQTSTLVGKFANIKYNLFEDWFKHGVTISKLR